MGAPAIKATLGSPPRAAIPVKTKGIRSGPAGRGRPVGHLQREARPAMPDRVRDTATEVFQVNTRFYDAVTGSDLEEMESLWCQSGEERCIHPGWDVLMGWESISDSWSAIFSSTPGLRIRPRGVEVVVLGEMAWVHCLEEIFSGAETGESPVEAAGGEEPSFARATNLYRNTGEGWKMILHHASPIPGDPGEVEGGSVH